MLFDQYQSQTDVSDITIQQGLLVPILGLCGEIGEITSVIKKRVRDQRNYKDFSMDLREESGDALWYLCSISRHLGVQFRKVATDNLQHLKAIPVSHICTDLTDYQTQALSTLKVSDRHREFVLAGLIKNAGNLLKLYKNANEEERKTDAFHDSLVKEVGDILWFLAILCKFYFLDLSLVAHENIEKITSIHDEGVTCNFDKNFPPEQSFPRKMEFTILEVAEGGDLQVKLFANNDPIGNPLKDNTYKEDQYRFHDAFHIANMAILGWSPNMRMFLDIKRKNDKKTDEVEDGGRARIIEEAVLHFVFVKAQRLDLFENKISIDSSILKEVKELTGTLEVKQCTFKQWERALLEGYRIFRLLCEHHKGKIKVDLDAKTITFEEIND